jgi:hypothetical protein
MLKITSEGRKAALDVRSLDPNVSDHAQSKVSLAARHIHEIWKETVEGRSTQLVFCDFSTPKAGAAFSVYDDLKLKLVQAGVPDGEIAFIQDYESDAAKLSLFKDVREGKVRVLLGSTQKMGTGTNVQARLYALHHLDAPWRPADIEQREGRILRQGNRNPTVKIFRYVTEGSFDAYMWQTLETKAKFISQVMTGENNVRKIEDLDSPALTYAEVKAIASGNPLVIEKAKVDVEVMRFTRLRSQHQEAQYRNRSAIRQLEEHVPVLERKIQNSKVDLATRQNTKGVLFSITVESQVCSDRGIAGELIGRAVKRSIGIENVRTIGRFAGFELQIWPERVDEVILKGATTYAAKVSENPLGTISSMEHVVRSLDEYVADREKELVETKQRVSDLRPHLTKPFEHEEKLQELVCRQSEIVKAFDLTKSQASHQLGTEEVVQFENEMEKKSVPITMKVAV